MICKYCENRKFCPKISKAAAKEKDYCANFLTRSKIRSLTYKGYVATQSPEIIKSKNVEIRYYNVVRVSREEGNLNASITYNRLLSKRELKLLLKYIANCRNL